MPIDSTHPQYIKRLPDWELIDNVTGLENLTQYLRYLNKRDTSEENKQRNRDYQEAAVFYPVSQNTAQGMIGSIFRKWPTLNVPPELEYLGSNADGAGNSIYQSSQGACYDVLRKGRAGIAVSFPETQGQVSRADILSGRVVATIHRYDSQQIINWRVEQDGANAILSLVVTREEMDGGNDPYKVETETVYRERYLDFERDAEGEIIVGGARVYRERIWKTSADKVLHIAEESTPTDGSGSTWEVIPFMFIGSENNDPSIDLPPLLGMCRLNIGHYRNSADYEDSVWYNGQAQSWMSGVDQAHVDMMKANKMYVGSRSLLAVPSGEQFGFAQPLPNTLVKEAMDAKINAMVQMGARLMQVGSATKTAQQAAADQEAQTSLLAMVASNVSEAYTQAVKWAARYMGADDSEIAYTLSQEFVNLKAEPQEIQQIVAGFVQGVVPVGDYTRYMRRQGLFSDDVPDEEYADLLAREGVM